MDIFSKGFWRIIGVITVAMSVGIIFPPAGVAILLYYFIVKD